MSDLSSKFDLSDVFVEDTLKSVLDVAREVMLDYGPDRGATRIERMAMWLVRALGEQVEENPLLTGDPLEVLVCIRDEFYGNCAPGEARALAQLLLRAADDAEADQPGHAV